MGQWPHLLCLPGVAQRPGFRPDRVSRFLPSKSFAANLALAEHELEGEYVDGRIERVERLDGEFAITISDGRRFRAARIDVCCGPGPAIMPEDRIAPAELRNSTQRAWKPVVSGEEFLADGEWHPAHGKVCVLGGGGTGAWCVQEALASGNEVLWVSRNGFANAFVPSGRNDGLLHSRRRNRAKNWSLAHSVAPNPRLALAMAQGYHLAAASSGTDAKIRLSFVEFPGEVTARYFAAPGSGETGLGQAVCDQLVVASGHYSSGPGSSAALFEEFVPSRPPHLAEHAILSAETDSRLLGLRSACGAVRILGASVDSHPLVAEMRNQEFAPVMWRDDYWRHLCAQASGPGLIPASANDIAEANSYFEASPNGSINTAPPGQLRRVLARYLATEDEVDEACDRILHQRQARQRPFVGLDPEWIEAGFGLDYMESGKRGTA
ncbi:MAG: hypothetical protein U0Q16_10050 [Bryobacteraceae bacterium]